MCFYDMPTYIKYLYHEIYHYIVPENREQRNIYMGQFLVSIGYEKLIMGIIECCLRKTENSEKVKEFIFPIVASIISNIYPQIHFDLKSKYKIQTKDVSHASHSSSSHSSHGSHSNHNSHSSGSHSSGSNTTATVKLPKMQTPQSTPSMQ